MTSFLKKNLKHYRHGDLLIKQVAQIPQSAIPLSTSIIAEGEKTGHSVGITSPPRTWSGSEVLG